MAQQQYFWVCICKNITIFNTSGPSPHCPTITLPPVPWNQHFVGKSATKYLRESRFVVYTFCMLVPCSAKKWGWWHVISGRSCEAGVTNSIHEIQRARAVKYNLFPDRNTKAFLKEISISPKEAVLLIGRWQRGAENLIAAACQHISVRRQPTL